MSRRSGSTSFADRSPSVLLARRNLTRNRLRSGLAVLGIVIGVFAIAALGILGTVLELTATESLGGLGDQVIVTPNAETGSDSLDSRDVQQIERIATGAEVVPLVTGGAVVERGERRSFVTLYGTEEPASLFVAADGELPERHVRGAIVGSEVADDLGVGVGRTLGIEGRQYRIVAVLEPAEGISPVSPDGAVILPPAAFVQEEVTQVIVQADSGAEAARIAGDVRSQLNAREDRVDVFELSSIIDQIGDFFDLLSAFLLAIGSISLLVAGVSILNVMLMSTSERREEIGVFRAVGVQKRDVMRMILVEATLLGVVGGLLGVALAVAGTAVLYLLVAEVTLSAVLAAQNGFYLLVSFGFGVVVSLVSGLYPAWTAANERPVDALRGS
ncbi:putative ABC transport system permease protein [Halogranum amylolyticum]|uniref:Putative ABC transport system permease protein n=1 Tax=Halogranum amylolyticum TaxID=660520 RepID=A0A1H8N3C2_9EURY|nr:ABC transporter permease [Halogranum amylolyticum]SEO24107.1 putative ABC transport system permease protein [Halogranum amylolyticum]